MVGLHRRGLTWWVSYQDGGRQVRRSLKTQNKKVAKDRCLEIEWSLRNGNGAAHAEPSPVPAAPPGPRRVPIDDLRDRYRRYCKKQKAAKTAHSDENRLKEFFNFARVRFVDEITTVMVGDFIERKTERGDIKPATVKRYREILHAMMEYARRRDLATENPVSRIETPRIPEYEPRFLTLEQIDDFLKRTRGDKLFPIIATAIYSGLRRDEICWLTRSDADLSGNRPVLRVRAKTVDGESWIPKTKRNRAVPIAPKLRSILDAAPRTKKVPWLFPSPHGCRWDPDNLSHHLRTLTKRLKLPWNFLDMRHTFGSQLARKGVSLIKIAKLMGNSPEICRRHYINLLPEELADDVEF